MFQQARLKLTAWYLFIIVLITLAFSTIIYRDLSFEIERFARVQRVRIQRGFYVDILPPPFPGGDDDLVNETKKRLLLMLSIIDGSIFILAGGLGYLLAGRTLKPIKEMLDEQSRFVSDSSHEFRTPLTSLKSAFEVSLRDKHLTTKDARILITESIVEVNKLQSLSDGLLKLSQYEKNRASLSFTNTSLDDILRASLKKMTPLADQKKITLQSTLSPLNLVADPHGLEELFTILLENAVKYSPPSTTVILSSSRSDNYALISVADQGIGITAEDLPHIFDRFYRADSARTKNDIGGYGLGLSIAKRLISIHHGSITVKSKPGVGSIFTIKLPLRQFSLSSG